MALNQSRRWLIAYDLRDNRRIQRLHRLLARIAVPVQYSVFAAEGSVLGMRRLAKEIEELIDAEVDDVRMYPIPARSLVHTIGRSMLPDQALLVDAGGQWSALVGPAGAAVRAGRSAVAAASTGARPQSSTTTVPSHRREMQNSACLREPQP